MNYTDTSLQAHLTISDEIGHLAGQLLGPVDGLAVLEPSVGEGHLLAHLKGKPRSIDAFDLNGEYLSTIRDRFGGDVSFSQLDFIEDRSLPGILGRAMHRGDYDCVIANPPYGLKFTRDYR